MTDVMLLWDNPLLFEKLFTENGLKCQRVLSTSVGTPFLPPCKCVVIPTGFANPAYTKICPGIENNGRSFERFVRSGGILVVFGALMPEYEHDWLPMKLTYVEKHGEVGLVQVSSHEVSCIADVQESVECDGYYTETDGKVVIENSEGNAVLVVKEVGDGLVIATTIHEFPSSAFLKYIGEKAKRSKI
jgi:hypothetical protein